MKKISAFLLIPIAYAGVFSTFPIVEPVFWPNTWQDVLIMVALLAPAYAYMLAAIVWMRTWKVDREFLGLSRTGWLMLSVLAFVAGSGCVILLKMV